MCIRDRSQIAELGKREQGGNCRSESVHGPLTPEIVLAVVHVVGDGAVVMFAVIVLAVGLDVRFVLRVAVLGEK